MLILYMVPARETLRTINIEIDAEEETVFA